MFTESLSSRMLPAPRNGGFAMDDYWVWCGSAIQGEDSRYHMFAARWPKNLPFFNGYLTTFGAPAASGETAEIRFPRFDNRPPYLISSSAHKGAS